MKRLAFLAVLVLTAVAGAVHYVPPQKYGQEFTLHFSIYDSNSPWQYYETAPAADDVYIRKDGGAAARASNAVTDLNHTMSLTLTAAEMTAAVITVDVNDETSPPLFGSDTWIIYTHGNASAQNAFDLDTASVTVGTNSDKTGYALSAAGIDGIHNDLLTNNKIKNSAGYFIQQTKGGAPVDVSVGLTAQAGGTGNTIKLAASSSSEDNAYRNMLVELISGAGAPCTRTIISYDGSTKIATVGENWPGTAPNQTTTYTLWAAPSSTFAHEGLAQAGDATTITLATDAPSTSSITGWIKLRSGTGSPDTQEIVSYNGTTKVLTVAGWTGDAPSTDTYYALIPFGATTSDTTTPAAGLTMADLESALSNFEVTVGSDSVLLQAINFIKANLP